MVAASFDQEPGDKLTFRRRNRYRRRSQIDIDGPPRRGPHEL